ncbi:hypothetical protein [Sanguibacter sp. Z1732]|uniref:hypothetical protein n=1 Tax=Sanguibacter sp. Z1732 TaxID=3435412 RepID=UPI003D9C883E
MTSEAAVERFWIQARIEGNLNRLEVVIGQNVQNTVPPPVWSTSPDPATATAEVEELLSSGTMTQAVPVADLTSAGQPPAQVGDLGIVLDGEGEPRALVRTVTVDVAESHPDVPDAAAGTVQVEHLEVLYPRRRKRHAREKVGADR